MNARDTDIARLEAAARVEKLYEAWKQAHYGKRSKRLQLQRPPLPQAPPPSPVPTGGY